MRFQEVFGSEMPKVSIQSRFTLDFDDKKKLGDCGSGTEMLN